ncbi:nopp 140 functions as a transcriptional activator [Diplodia corticola]|uniref:Nopp 140 functions as a transcriptional activator n=1 Tax=Diplodia corticola TaxID=236234 RepID=A0A1J9QY39_9PEZI|nr:nopp 140 functions as a transcriptional activator [Diplodia corticola]OJD32914.1 nopp 140 functions as a transcriptional activator [Diplodia corticola]
MSSIGPSLPPHLAKRKRDDNDDDDDRSSSSSSASSSPGPRPASSLDNNAEKRRRVVAGPAPPPAPLDEMPATAPGGESDESSDSDSDDGFGPALPTAADVSRVNAAKKDDDEWSAVRPRPGDEDGKEKKAQRDEWMMVPPKQDDLAARLDPTKLRARGFQTGKGARAPNHGGGGGDLGMWLETPEQKKKRLENEVMGKGGSSGGPGSAGGERDARRKRDDETARRLRKHEEKRKGESLYEKHREKVGEKEDDDPSKRAFDYQKDMASGMRIDGTKRKEMIRKAGDFSSKFSGGSFL